MANMQATCKIYSYYLKAPKVINKLKSRRNKFVCSSHIKRAIKVWTNKLSLELHWWVMNLKI